jgi:hypothetical protein
MTAPPAPLTPDATRCPDCRSLLTRATDGTPHCQRCGLTLAGPSAVRLWEVDTELLRLDAARGELLTERARLLTALRPHGDPGASVAPGIPSAAEVPEDWRPARPRAEWTPQRVQNLLLVLGGLLLAVAALVFAAVTYDRLGAGGRAAVLVALTLAVGAAAPVVRARGLSATAETLGAVGLVLAALDAYGLRTLGLAEDADPLAYAAGSAAVIAVVAGAYATVVPLRLVRCAAVALTQVPVLLLLAAYDASAGTTGLVLAALAAVDLAVLAALRSRPVLPADAVRVLVVSTAVASALGIMAGLSGGDTSAPEGAAAALVAHSAVLVAAALLVRSTALRTALTAGPVLLLAVAASALTRDGLTDPQLPLVPAAVGLIAVQVAAQLPRGWRAGPALGSLLVAALAVLTVAEPVVSGLLLPLTWLIDPWSLAAGSSARGAVGPGTAWDGTVVTTMVLAAAALTAGTAGVALHRLRAAAAPFAALVLATVVLLPLGLALSYPVALVLLLGIAVALVGAGAALLGRHPLPGLAVVGTGAAVALFASAWSLADRDATLVVLPLVAVLLAGIAAVRRLPSPPAAVAVALTGLFGAAALGAHGAAQGLADDQVGGLLLVAVTALVVLAAAPRPGARPLDGARLLGTPRRLGAELAAGAVALVAAALAVADAGWLSWVLAATGLLALVTALLPDRRRCAVLGGLLLSASSWVRLLAAGVEAPEPYVLPLAVLALGLGHLRRRAVPDLRSWAAYGPGLLILLVPSLLASFDDESPTRALLLGLVALGVLLVGARARLQAPLAVGAGVLAVDALQLVGPYAAALPRWLSLGAAGVLLVAVGATYEQRRQDVARLREGYDALA